MTLDLSAFDVAQDQKSNPLTENGMHRAIEAAFNGLGVYVDFTPVWVSSGTAPALGNATLTGRYAQIGKQVHCYGRIVFGSTSTFGSGTYKFGLPVLAAANAVNSRVGGPVELFDTSASATGLGRAQITDNNRFAANYGATYLGTLTAIGPAAPWTWATGDIVAWNLTYEAA